MNSILKATFLCTATTLASVAHAQAGVQIPSDVPSQIAADAEVYPSKVSDPAAGVDAPQGAASVAEASQPASESGGEIVVTARRRNENLQDVPASVSVLT